MLTAHNHYEVLGIGRDANAETIKRAWVRLVRVHTPDKDPEGNRRINEAKVTLLDPRARRDYDTLLDYGDEITELMNEATEASENEEWDDAIRAYKEILAFHPENHAARNRLAICQANADDELAARRTMEYLLSKEPSVPVYWSNYGHILQNFADEKDITTLNKAAEAFERAAQLEPHNAAHQISLSQHWRSRKDYRKAEHYIDLAVAADGKADLDDLEALFELPMIHFFAGEPGKFSDDARRISALIPPDNDDAKEYATFRFLKMAAELSEHSFHIQAGKVVEAARVIRKHLGEHEEFAKGITLNGKIGEQSERLQTDSNLIQPIQALGLIYVDVYFGYLEHEKASEYIEGWIEALGTYQKENVYSSVSRLKSLYNHIYDLNTKFFDAIKDSSSGYSGGSSRSTQAAASSGCILPVAGLVCLIFLGLYSLLLI